MEFSGDSQPSPEKPERVNRFFLVLANADSWPEAETEVLRDKTWSALLKVHFLLVMRWSHFSNEMI
jgi:hypothetical protein